MIHREHQVQNRSLVQKSDTNSILEMKDIGSSSVKPLRKFTDKCVVEFIPKHCLKKCRSCGFKKRSCVMNKLSCKALNRRCYICQKQGHFPKSIKCNCRKRRFIVAKNQKTDVDEKIFMHKFSLNQENYCISSRHILIPQFDGGNDEEMSIISSKKLYAVNCEIDEVSIVANFIRSCDFLWKLSKSHELCEYNSKHKEMNCFF